MVRNGDGGNNGPVSLSQIWIHCRKVLEYPFSFKDPTYQLYFIHGLNQTC